MLRLLKLTNFRCFADFEVQFEKFDVLVGKNSMGKSTIIDALKLVSNVLRFAKYRKGRLEDRDIPFPLTNLRYNYQEEETRIFTSFDDMTEIEVIFPVFGSPVANLVKAGTALNRKDMTYLRNALGMIPPVGTFEESERIGDPNYVRSVMVSHLTPRNFRNIWTFFPDGFDEFCRIVEETWPDCSVLEPEPHAADNRIDMFFKESGKTREIFWAGHGFQIWLQLMTYIVKLGHCETLVLDEPDIYLHSDMQKKLVAVCKKYANQVIIATHAVDIIEEVEPEEVISIDRTLNSGKRVRDIGELQRSVSLLGSQQNLRLTRLLRNRTILFVEGDDFRYLKGLATKLGYSSFAQESGFSVAQLEGFQNWNRLRYVNWTLNNVLGEKVKVAPRYYLWVDA
jgi:ABC-type ATPase involved in cell division